MKTIGTLLAMGMVAILTSNIVSSEQLFAGGALSQAWNPNQMEPFRRQAREARQLDEKPNLRPTRGVVEEAWACGVLCPDDDAFIPYRSPRPTKGKFIGIHG